MYDISALALKLLNFKFEHWCASIFISRQHLSRCRFCRQVVQRLCLNLYEEKNIVYLKYLISIPLQTRGTCSARPRRWRCPPGSPASLACAGLWRPSRRFGLRKIVLYCSIYFSVFNLSFINYPLPIRELRLREDTVTDRRFRWMVSLNEQMIWFQIDHSSIINNQRIIYRLLLENRLHMTPWFILSKLWTILGTNSQLSWVDGFERLILNGFKTEDIFLSHGCNKNNKNVECKNKSFREEKVQLVKQ